MKFLPKCLENLFKKMFPIFSKLPSNFFEDFQISVFFSNCYTSFSSLNIFAKFLPSFLKTFAKFFLITKFHQKLRNTNFYTPMFFHRFFKISSHLLTIQSYSIMSAKAFQKSYNFSRYCIKIFQQPN